MSAIDPTKILSYGAIGLGFLLAFFSYRLLAKEQGRQKASPPMIRAIYAFMGFSFLLTLVGLVSEALSRQPAVQLNSNPIVAPAALPAERPMFYVYGRIEDVQGRPIEGVTVKVFEIRGGAVKEIGSHKSNDAGSFDFDVGIPPDSRIKIVTHQRGYRGHQIILQPNAVTIPTTLTKVGTK